MPSTRLPDPIHSRNHVCLSHLFFSLFLSSCRACFCSFFLFSQWSDVAFYWTTLTASLSFWWPAGFLLDFNHIYKERDDNFNVCVQLVLILYFLPFLHCFFSHVSLMAIYVHLCCWSYILCQLLERCLRWVRCASGNVFAFSPLCVFKCAFDGNLCCWSYIRCQLIELLSTDSCYAPLAATVCDLVKFVEILLASFFLTTTNVIAQLLFAAYFLILWYLWHC